MARMSAARASRPPGLSSAATSKWFLCGRTSSALGQRAGEARGPAVRSAPARGCSGSRRTTIRATAASGGAVRKTARTASTMRACVAGSSAATAQPGPPPGPGGEDGPEQRRSDRTSKRAEEAGGGGRGSQPAAVHPVLHGDDQHLADQTDSPGAAHPPGGDRGSGERAGMTTLTAPARRRCAPARQVSVVAPSAIARRRPSLVRS